MGFRQFLKLETKDFPFSRLAFGLVVFGMMLALAGLWWTGRWRSDVNFLPNMAPAEWIVYPVAPDVNTHPKIELPVVFTRSFELNVVPAQARVRIAGFHRYTFLINGSLPGPRLHAGVDWKDPDTYDVAGLLHSGINRIEVTVFNATGPAALWLALDAGGLPVNSGDAWQASLAGASWRAAVSATAPRPTAAYGAVYDLPRPLTALSQRWSTLLFFTLLAVTGWWLPHWNGLIASRHPRLGDWFNQSALWKRIRSNFPIVAVLGIWLALFGHNIPALLHLTGFDSPAHLDYIRFIQERHSLPLANAGWEMFQPPLYYLLSALWLGLLHLSVSDASGLVALRILGLAISVTHLVIVWAALRLLFPGKGSKAAWGLLLAAVLPPMIYLSLAVTNEAFAAMMVSVCVWLTLSSLQQDRLTGMMCAMLGLFLGAALLAKATALLVLPFVFGALLWHWLKTRTMAFAQWIARISSVMVLCFLVCGWHYARVWRHFGNPLIANWDARLGFSWWQDDGFRTSAFYLRWGDVLLHPWSGVSHSLGNGLYATLWGDGMLSGASTIFTRPPWNYDLMASGYWLALIPTLTVLAGGMLAVRHFVRRPTPEWFLLLGFGGLALWAVVNISLVVPYYSLVKAFFGLSALIPLSALGAWGLDSLRRSNAGLAGTLSVAFLVWAANSYASFWVARSSVPWAYEQAVALARDKRFHDAIEFLEQRLRSDPQNADLEFLLAYFLTQTGQVEKGADLARSFVGQHPDDSRGPYALALALAKENQAGKAFAQLEQVIRMTPGFDTAWENFLPLLDVARSPDEAVAFCRQALAVTPYNQDLRLTLGVALLWQGREMEARTQLNYVCLSKPGAIDELAARAWELATAPKVEARNGAVAIRCAEVVCAITKYSNTRYLLVLAAAYAEGNRYADAVKCAVQAEARAMGSTDAAGIAASRELLQNLKNGLPCRQP